MKTIFYNNNGKIKRSWKIIDAKDVVLGRLSSKISLLLQGKEKAHYTPHCILGDFIIVVNAKLVSLHKSKEKTKIYWRHTGYPGGIKKAFFQDLKAESPKNIILHSVKGMLPKNKISKRMIKNIKIYEGEFHPHKAQKPVYLRI